MSPVEGKDTDRALLDDYRRIAAMRASIKRIRWAGDTHHRPGRRRADKTARLIAEANRKLAALNVQSLPMAVGFSGRLAARTIRRLMLHALRIEAVEAARIPQALLEEVSRQVPRSYEAWATARRTGEWEAFQEHLRANVELARRWASAVDDHANPYDAFLGAAEPGLSTDQFDAIVNNAVTQMRPTWRRLEFLDGTRPEPLDIRVSQHDRLEFLVKLLGRIGLDMREVTLRFGRRTYCASITARDTRIALDRQAGLFDTVFGALHEAGHAMYFQGIDRGFDRTPLWGGASAGMQEAQARLWEVVLGHSDGFLTMLSTMLADTLDRRIAPKAWLRKLQAGLMLWPTIGRVDAHEVVYGAHVVIRYRLERALLDGTIGVDELDSQFQNYAFGMFGRDVVGTGSPMAIDPHWAGFSFGVLPSYLLGDIIAVQLLNAATKRPSMVDQLEYRRYHDLTHWLRRRVYRFGRAYDSLTLLRQATGKGFDVDGWATWLRFTASRIQQ